MFSCLLNFAGIWLYFSLEFIRSLYKSHSSLTVQIFVHFTHISAVNSALPHSVWFLFIHFCLLPTSACVFSYSRLLRQQNNHVGYRRSGQAFQLQSCVSLTEWSSFIPKSFLRNFLRFHQDFMWRINIKQCWKRKRYIMHLIHICQRGNY